MLTATLGVIVLLSFILMNLLLSTESDEKYAVIYYEGNEVERIDLKAITDTKEYIVMGKNGPVYIEAEPGKVRVTEETSPLHLCSVQGWSDSPIQPIVCLPNKIVIKIESNEESDYDSILK